MCIAIDNSNLEATFTDPWPHTTGNYASFRTGNCVYDIDFFEIYKARTNSISATVGNGTTDIPFQNFSVGTPAGQIKSISIDGADNISLINYRYVNVDWTKPSPAYANDGTSADIDTIYRNDKISGNWGGGDQNSGIKKTYIGVGTTPGVNNIISWTDIGTITQYTSVVNLTYGTTYYINFQIFNGAGLDTIITSDGQFLEGSIFIDEQPKTVTNLNIYPNPYSDIFNVSFSSLKTFEGNFSLINSAGKIVYQQKENIINGENNFTINAAISHISSGHYFLKLDSQSENILLGIKTIKK